VSGEPRDWRLKDWLRHFGKRQSALVNDLGWSKAKASETWHGVRSYRRAVVNEVADWLGVEPYELLMRPEDALALRRLRETAAAIVAESPATPFDHAPLRKSAPPRVKGPRNGTTG